MKAREVMLTIAIPIVASYLNVSHPFVPALEARYLVVQGITIKAIITWTENATLPVVPQIVSFSRL